MRLSSLAKILISTFIISIIGMVVCTMENMTILAITFGMFTYHIGVRFLSPVFLQAITHRHYNYYNSWFQKKSWEDALYRFLRVKEWKNKALTWDPREFSLEYYSMKEIAENMCHAEVTHEIIIVMSLFSVLFSIPFGELPVFIITALLAALLDTIFVVIQRYNRPRVVHLIEKKNSFQYKKEQSTHQDKC